MQQSFLQSLRVFAEAIYEDQCDVWRNQTITKPNGSKAVQFCLLKEGIACRLSQINRQDVRFVEELPMEQSTQTAKVYCSPEEGIVVGDRLHVTHFGECMVFEAAQPFVYSSHMEIPVKRVVEA